MTLRGIRNCCIALFAFSIGGYAKPEDPDLPLASTGDVIARMEAIAGGTNDVLVKLSLKQMAAELRAGLKRGKLRRSKTLGTGTAGQTTGENGEPGGPLLPGWGPNQYIMLGDPAFQVDLEYIHKKCVKTGKMKQADLDCLMTDIMVLTLIHEWVHMSQRSGVPLDDAARKATHCEAYRIECAMTSWFLNELPKYGGVAKACTIAHYMKLQMARCETGKAKECT